VPLPAGFTPGLEATAYHTTQRPVYADGSNVAEVEVGVELGAVTLRGWSARGDPRLELGTGGADPRLVIGA